ncbi:hypothetical protein [Brachyspira murdochii]|uniref:Uncharacterized protein n=1 Tax=Brachyspira murdochii TaxID=84378 RepID=A0ABX5B2W8_9SPIR|nr:hypothetical protein [Brachyspira murdochii]PPS21626.1 hypothetical protein DJ52_09655 [Brachyspira murdochii]
MENIKNKKEETFNKLKNDFEYCYGGMYKNQFTDDALKSLFEYLINKNKKRFNILDLIYKYDQVDIKEYEYKYRKEKIKEDNKYIIKIFCSGYLLYKIH